VQDLNAKPSIDFWTAAAMDLCSPKTDTDIILLELFIRRSASLNIPRRFPTAATSSSDFSTKAIPKRKSGKPDSGVNVHQID
jgi:hypothetical protein